MPIDVQCTACGYRLGVSDTVTGKQDRCPKCDAILLVPASVEQPPDILETLEAEDFLPAEDPKSSTNHESSSQEDDFFSEVAKGLAATKPWVLFLAVIGYIGCTLQIVAGGFLFYSVVASSGRAPLSFLIQAIVSFVTAMFSLFISGLLHNYASKISDFLNERAIKRLEEVIHAQMKYWVMIGVIALAAVSLITLLLIASVVGILLA